MGPNRLEVFSDGVLAIIIAIMVLELKVPDLAALGPLVPVLLSDVLSFVDLGIYWNSHHHMLQVTQRLVLGNWMLSASALSRVVKQML